jgi:kumamolisin
MIAVSLALAIATTGNPPAAVGVSLAPATPGVLGPALQANTPVHLGISLRSPSIDAARKLAASQQDPPSADFRRWLTPADFGKQFGVSVGDYARVQGWLTAAGFAVTAFDDRVFIEAFGTHAMVQALLGVQLFSVQGLDGHAYRTYQGDAQAPADVAALVLNITGLDTQPRFHPRLRDTQGIRTFGPQDLRRFYDLQPLLDLGYTGRGAQLVVLGVATDNLHAPRAAEVKFFFDNYADTKAQYRTRTLPNLNEDVDSTSAAREEMEIDVEVQAIAAPGASSITLELPPASEQLSTGAHDVATTSNVTAVSTSFGTCEANISQQEAQSMEQLVLLGTLAGQTWVAAAGDLGADDCGTGMSASVDMPAAVPEMLAAGGTAVKTLVFDQNDAVTRYETEITWNQTGVGAGGGGSSTLYSKPSWQASMTPNDLARDLPDLALLASPSPGVAVDTEQTGRTLAVGGTSVAAPLAAGMFALLADKLGCRLGGVNPALYAVGAGQSDGGIAAFHDIVTGNNGFDGVTGAAAAVGFDLATGWGSVDVQALAAAFPACAPDAGFADAGPLVPYDSCAEIGCPAGSICDTDPEGPSYCFTACDPVDAGSCGSGNVCTLDDAGGGRCLPGCLSDDDCGDGQVCDSCAQSCQTAGNQTARIGDACATDSDCAEGASCLNSSSFSGGYCTQFCDGCACPTGAMCVALNLDVCLAQCQGDADCRDGYRCQPLATKTGLASACLPHCQSDDDCIGLDPGTQCDVQTGACRASTPSDAGAGVGQGSTSGMPGGGHIPSMEMDGGNSGHGGSTDDAGSAPIVIASSAGSSGGGVTQPGLQTGGCSQSGDLGWGGGLLAAVVLLRRRTRTELR